MPYVHVFMQKKKKSLLLDIWMSSVKHPQSNEKKKPQKTSIISSLKYNQVEIWYFPDQGWNMVKLINWCYVAWETVTPKCRNKRHCCKCVFFLITVCLFLAGKTWIPGEMERMGNEVSASLNFDLNGHWQPVASSKRGVCLCCCAVFNVT